MFEEKVKNEKQREVAVVVVMVLISAVVVMVVNDQWLDFEIKNVGFILPIKMFLCMSI